MQLGADGCCKQCDQVEPTSATRILAHTHCVARRQVPMDSSLDSPCEKLAGSTPTTPGGRDLPNELRDL